MLSSVIQYIDQRLLSLGFMPVMYGLVDRILVDGKEIPAQFCKGEWKYLYDFSAGFIYHRIIGEISTEDVEEEETVSCEAYERKTYPMRCVFLRDKKAFSNDVYDSEKIGNEIASYLKVSNNKSVCIAIGADIVEVLPNSINTNIYDVFEEEFTGVEMIPLDYIMVSVDYEIIIQGQIACFDTICTNGEVNQGFDYSRDYS